MEEALFHKAIDLDGLPRACPARPRVAARIKAVPEDFVVEEVPAYEPEGAGAHLFLWVEKRDCPGGDMLRQLAAALRIDPRDVGTAGTKDRRAVTRQWVSVPAVCEPGVATLDIDRVRVLEVRRHGNKLRLGHLRGNRFRILLRGADPAAAGALAATGATLSESGFFNLYGSQRFGRGGETLLRGLDMLGGVAARRMGGFERRMTVSAVQSALFNLYVAERVGRGLAGTALAGDLMAKTETGGLFRVEDVAAEQARLDSREIRVTGPMFGHKMMTPRADALALEASVLDAAGIETAAFKVFQGLAEGTRRPIRVWPSDLAVAAREDGIELSFFLPKGSYASVMLREFVESADAAEDAGASDSV